jgi:hypothetical protein
MDNNVLLVLLIIAIFLIVIAWYLTKIYLTIDDSKELELDTDIDMMAEPELKSYIKNTFELNLNNKQIAKDLLKRLYDIIIPDNVANSIIIGVNIDDHYLKLTNKQIVPYNNDMPINDLDKLDVIFKLRNIIGKNCDIAIINNLDIRNKLKYNYYNINELHDFLNSKLVNDTIYFMRNLLNDRWEKIQEIKNPNVLNSEGSFLYLQNIENLNVKGLKTDNGCRINLLCGQLEFYTFLKRLKGQTLSNNKTNHFSELLSLV